MNFQTMTAQQLQDIVEGVQRETERRHILREEYRRTYRGRDLAFIRSMLEILEEREDVLGELNPGDQIEREVLETELARQYTQTV